MSEKNRVGSKINQLRETQEMSVEDLAQKSQSSVELIEQLEAGEYVPSLTPLLSIARALGVRLGTFLDDDPQDGPLMVKSGQSEKVVRFSGKGPLSKESTLDFFSLAADKKDRHMEPFVIDVHPMNSDERLMSSHEGEEFIYVLDGGIEVWYGKERYTLAKGDSIYYDSVVPHDLHAGKEADAKILAVVYAPF